MLQKNDGSSHAILAHMGCLFQDCLRLLYLAVHVESFLLISRLKILFCSDNASVIFHSLNQTDQSYCAWFHPMRKKEGNKCKGDTYIDEAVKDACVQCLGPGITDVVGLLNILLHLYALRVGAPLGVKHTACQFLGQLCSLQAQQVGWKFQVCIQVKDTHNWEGYYRVLSPYYS